MKKWVDRFNGLLLALMFLTTFYQILIDRLPLAASRIIRVVSNLLILIFGVIFVWSAYLNFLNNWNFYAPSMDWMRLSYLYLGLLISGVLMIWYLLVNLVKDLFSKRFSAAQQR